jgi:hypothetical protein
MFRASYLVDEFLGTKYADLRGAFQPARLTMNPRRPDEPRQCRLHAFHLHRGDPQALHRPKQESGRGVMVRQKIAHWTFRKEMPSRII